MGFITENFLLQSETARDLYRTCAEGAPIFDYHCHLSPREIAENRSFRNLAEIWLEGDHYKWRAMRAVGVAEKYCSGDASPYEKFLAWARTVPNTLRNPLYHWTHLELVRYFGIDHLLDALRKRHEYFHLHGCRLSDHGLNYCYSEHCEEHEAANLFGKLRSGQALDPEESAKFASYLMLFFGRLDAERNWTKQLHLGAYRNANTRMLRSLGRDMGFDSIGDWPQAAALATYLDRLDRENSLPKMIIFNVNPADNYVFASLIGSFQRGDIPGKVQFGTSWWFLDHREGIEWQLNALSNCGLLSTSVGMVTDSRSFMSFPRHEYFRRVLCNLLGSEIEAGLLPDEKELIGRMIKNICLGNALNYLGLPVNGLGAETPTVDSAQHW